MAWKAWYFGDTNRLELILSTSDPKTMKNLGRRVKPFNPKGWDIVKESIVFSGNYAKFTSSEEMKSYLLSTGDRKLAEANPKDQIWGTGCSTAKAMDKSNWTGDNLLGECLMEVRRVIQEGGASRFAKVLTPFTTSKQTFDNAELHNLRNTSRFAMEDSGLNEEQTAALEGELAVFQDVWANATYKQSLAIIALEHLSVSQTSPWDELKTLFGNIAPVGWLANHFADRERYPESSKNVLDSLSAEIDVGEFDDSEPRIGQDLNYKHEDEESLAWKHFKKAIKQWKQPVDMPSPFYDANLKPVRMHAAMGMEWAGLAEYQKDGVCMLIANENGLRGTTKGGTMLLDAMGLGKTAQIIAAMENNPIIGTQLFVLPKSLFANWREELVKFQSPSPTVIEYDGTQTAEELQSHDIVFVTYDRLQRQWQAMETYWKGAKYRKANPYPYPTTMRVGTDKYPRTVSVLHKRPDITLYLIKWARIVFDESQQFRNFRTSCSRACYMLDALSRRILTGTPLTNEYSDFFSFLRTLRVKPYDSWEWFKSHFLNRKERGEFDQMEINFVTRPGEISPLDITRAALLALACSVDSIRRTRDGSFNGVPLSQDIPAKHEENVFVGLDHNCDSFTYATKDVPAHQDLNHTMLVDDFFRGLEEYEKTGDWTDPNILRFADALPGFVPRSERETQYSTASQWCKVLRDAIDFERSWNKSYEMEDRDTLLSRITTAKLTAFHAAIAGANYGSAYDGDLDDVEGTGHKAQRERFVNWLAADESRWRSTKSVWIVDKIEADLQADKKNCFIVACYCLAALDIVAAGLRRRKITFLRFDGSMSEAERTAARMLFEKGTGGERVLLLSSKAGGVGLNFVRANRVILCIPEWAYATEAQVIGRAWRKGQKHEVFVYHLLARNSMDDRTLERQESKVTKGYSLSDLRTIKKGEVTDRDYKYCQHILAKIGEMMTWSKGRFLKELFNINIETEAEVIDEENEGAS
ncbi:P-loop containing nucleoside triphosphate hydrolase protein [Hyaloscypha variabilis F]|uniref:P-loop containing nucleoside triphosphate hydrolase protein n=1 Tax=Hyaloscypha variabilis (strain UAMH 11265 / GT02V1 / F) TaxID=1149755 RepID=A0A2J6R639_HYAVF|nr:P-loop containing nucleoside triphosphate hydrolase protein [Hyaloscypha variabilis F]